MYSINLITPSLINSFAPKYSGETMQCQIVGEGGGGWEEGAEEGFWRGKVTQECPLLLIPDTLHLFWHTLTGFHLHFCCL